VVSVHDDRRRTFSDFEQRPVPAGVFQNHRCLRGRHRGVPVEFVEDEVSKLLGTRARDAYHQIALAGEEEDLDDTGGRAQPGGLVLELVA
jgi:hypothetical protein